MGKIPYKSSREIDWEGAIGIQGPNSTKKATILRAT